MKIDYEKYKNIEIDKEKFKDIPTNVEQLRNCLAICYVLMEDKDKEIERLNSIIKEVREEIDYWGIEPDRNNDKTLRYVLKGILEILDKVEENSK